METNMRSAAKFPALVISGVVFLALPMVAFAYTGQELAPGAKVSIGRARAIALKAVPGKVTDQELEKESGGSGLRYSFKRGATTYEVGVDAQTGVAIRSAAGFYGTLQSGL
jgi:Peptidase propeptide and YPEB domain